MDVALTMLSLKCMVYVFTTLLVILNEGLNDKVGTAMGVAIFWDMSTSFVQFTMLYITCKIAEELRAERAARAERVVLLEQGKGGDYVAMV